MSNYLGETISLCISYRNSQDELWYYRIADYDAYAKELQDINYDDEVDYGDKIRNTLYSLEHKVEFKPILKRWQYVDYDSDRVNVLSGNPNIGKIYEIVYLDENRYRLNFDDKVVRKKLYDGFYIYPEVSEEFLLIIGAEKDELFSLLCKKKDFKVKKDEFQKEIYYLKSNVDDLNKDVISFPMYKISSTKIVSTENLTEFQFMKNIISCDRFFYCKLELPKNVNKYIIRDIEDLLPAFISRYIKQKQVVFGVTNNERKKFVETIHSLLYDEKEVKEIFNITDFSYETIKNSIESTIIPILKLYSNQDDLNNLVEDYLLKDNRIFEKCIDEVRKVWILSKDEIRDKIENDINEITKLLESMQKDQNELNDSIVLKKKQIDVLDIEINEKNGIIAEVEHKKEMIQNEIKEQLTQFKSNIVETTKLLGIVESRASDASSNVVNKENNNNIFYLSSEEKCENNMFEHTEIENIDDFYDCICDNFDCYLEEVGDFAISILSILLSHKSIVIDDYLGRNIADDLSMLISSSTAEYFYIASTDIDSQNMINLINGSKSPVIYIEGLLSTYNDNLMIAICKNCSNKYIVFGSSKEIISTLPKNIWKYAYYIEYLDKIKLPTKTIKLISKNNVLKDLEYDFIQENEICKKLLKQRYIDKRQSLEYSLYSNIMDKIFRRTPEIDLINNISLCLESEKNNELINLLFECGYTKEQISKSILMVEE